MNDINVIIFDLDELIKSIVDLLPDLQSEQILSINGISPYSIGKILTTFSTKEIDITDDMNGHDMDFSGTFEFQGDIYNYWGSDYYGTLYFKL